MVKIEIKEGLMDGPAVPGRSRLRPIQDIDPKSTAIALMAMIVVQLKSTGLNINISPDRVMPISCGQNNQAVDSPP
jgi:hypothetical protein